MDHFERQDSKLITQSNELVEGQINFDLAQQRLFYLSLTKINTLDYSQGPLTVVVTFKDWCNIFPASTAYRKFRKTAESIRGKCFRHHPRKGVTREINVFSSAEYDDNTKTVTLTFNNEVKPKLQGMVEQYTQTNLIDISTIGKPHTNDLYWFLQQFKTTGYRVATLFDVRYALRCEEKYKTTKSFIQHVLNPAMNEINNKSDMLVKMEPLRSGREITHFKFYFNTKASFSVPDNTSS